MKQDHQRFSIRLNGRPVPAFYLRRRAAMYVDIVCADKWLGELVLTDEFIIEAKDTSLQSAMSADLGWFPVLTTELLELLLAETTPVSLSQVQQVETSIGEGRLRFPTIYLLHGRGGSPNGSVFQLESELRRCGLARACVRPLLPHSDPNVLPSTSLARLRDLDVPNGSLIVGVSLGGLVAAKLQEMERQDLHVVCISSPTYAEDTALNLKAENRVALFSSTDPVILGRTAKWPELAAAYDLPWLTHDTDMHKRELASLLCGYVERLAFSRELDEINAQKNSP